jgi:hypothetical protein
MELGSPVHWFIIDAGAVAALGMIVYGVLQCLRRPPERQWLRTEGLIRESRIEAANGWAARIRYSYSFRGESFEGSRISPLHEDAKHRSEQQAQRDRRRYPYGKTVTVYVNPEDPFDAVLEPLAGNRRAFLHVLAGLGGLVIVVVHAYAALNAQPP